MAEIIKRTSYVPRSDEMITKLLSSDKFSDDTPRAFEAQRNDADHQQM
ncbi:hypothetical protein A1Q_2639 [Vibrio campbellii HY01]|nr:hypothetical protein A1Q_2639 [Vibrio campbellii HY01]